MGLSDNYDLTGIQIKKKLSGSLSVSFPRKRKSRFFKAFWIPDFTGVTISSLP